MIKFVKICLITAAIMIGMGLFSGIIATAVGGRYIIREVLSGESWDFYGNRFLHFSSSGWQIGWNDNNSRYLSVNGERMSNREFDAQISSNGINRMQIGVGVGKFDIRIHDEDTFKVRIRGGGDCNFYTDGNTLFVDGFDYSSSWHNRRSNNLRSINTITLYVPAGIVLDEMEVEVGVGSMEMTELTLNRLTASVGVGALDMIRMTARQLDLSVAVGAASFSGSVNGNVTVSCDIGSASLHINGSQSDFDYDLSCSLGAISAGDISLAGMNSERRVDNRADKKMTLTTSIGSISVYFR
ncbi:MAG: DUF4097 family beta strand repeat-containing protein [Lachnospiraceae bacterium]|nr:DUF4097 family beta strand repeat-containing protein [Lachnospiraceae bacterium]